MITREDRFVSRCHWQRGLLLAVMLLLSVVASGQRRAALYDDWFHEARCELRHEVRADSIAWWLVVTLDEGDITVPRGSRLVMRLRGGIDVTLTSDRDVALRDITTRRWLDRTDHIITLYYPITEDQLALLHEHDLRHLRIETSQGWIERRIPRHLRLRMNAAR